MALTAAMSSVELGKKMMDLLKQAEEKLGTSASLMVAKDQEIAEIKLALGTAMVDYEIPASDYLKGLVQ